MVFLLVLFFLFGFACTAVVAELARVAGLPALGASPASFGFRRAAVGTEFSSIARLTAFGASPA